MGHKLRDLFSCSALFRDAILIFTLVIVAHQTFGVIVTGVGGIGPGGYLKVTVDAPESVKSAIRWGIHDDFGFESVSYNNGDTASLQAGNVYLSFEPIVGWAMPASTQIWITPYSTNAAYATNTFTGSCSFVAVLGEYRGLFSEPSGPKFESCGFLEIFGGKGLSFTGKISSAGHRYSFSGSFDQNGVAWATVPRAGTSPLSVHLVAGDDILTGEIISESWTATLLARRATLGSNPAQKIGKYTFAFAGGADPSAQPGGDSFGTMTVNLSGSITLAVTMSDGTKATQKTSLSTDQQWPLYIPLYSGKGFVFGWLQLQDPNDSGAGDVALYQSWDYYSGPSARMPLGDYDYSQLPFDFNYYNPTTWSVRVPFGRMVTLYTNDHFGGFGLTITTNENRINLGYLRSARVGINFDVPPDFGTITWMKPIDRRGKYYPAGFTNQLQAFVSKYQSAAQTPVLEYSVGKGIFQNGYPFESITNEFSIDSYSRMSGPNHFNLTIAPSSAVFRGNVKNPLTGKTFSFSGVVLQRQQFGRGFFLDGDQSGSVYFGP